MSQSATNLARGQLVNLPTSAYRARLKQLNRMLRQGMSWSGSERNCVYLNTRDSEGGRFANVSAVSGLDFLDDGRGLALVDWDHDGDLDAWSANRTAPQVRFVRNDTPSGHHFLMVRLQGRPTSNPKTNRDGIGARVELYLKDEPDRPMIRSLRGGEGYLSQSSKWIHFGLGKHSQIDRLVVKWPSAEADEFTRLLADRHYVLVQGSDEATPWTRPTEVKTLVSSQEKTQVESDNAQILLTVRPPLPPLKYKTASGTDEVIVGDRPRPILINLWASWCRPCLSELGEITRRQEDLKSAGLDVVALSVNGMGSADVSRPEDGAKVLAELKYPFLAGSATKQLVETLQLTLDRLFSLRRPLPLPCSFLVDRQGRLAAVYRGEMSVDRLLDDVSKLELDGAELLSAGLPFSGRWIVGARDYPRNFEAGLANDLIRSGHADTAMAYISRLTGPRKIPNKELAALLREAMRLDRRDPTAPFFLATLLEKRGQRDEAIRHYQQASVIAPAFREAHAHLAFLLEQAGKRIDAIGHYRKALEPGPERHLTKDQFARVMSTARNNLAWLLATHPDDAIRDGDEAARLLEQAMPTDRQPSASLLDTLAAAYAERGQFKLAVATAKRAIELATASNRRDLADKIERRRQLYEKGVPFRSE